MNGDKKIVMQERNFKINYNQVNNDLWRASAEVIDDLHQIKTWLDISVPELKIKDAGIEFKNMPFDECKLICDKAKKLIGTKLKELGFKNFRLFLGKDGCPNVYLQFGLSGPGFNSIYHLNLVNQNKMSQDEYNILMKNDCIAHREIIKKKG